MSPLPVSEYQVGVVCALPKEMAAVIAVMDEEHEPLKRRDAQDHNSYSLGRIHQHNVVVACLPAGVYGTNSAATVAKDMLRTFTGIRIGLMVGIGGGVPDLPKNDIRLGDIVVSQPDQAYGGVVQYDLGRSLTGGAFEHKGFLDKPPTVLLTALSALQTRQLLRGSQVPDYMKEATRRYPRMSGQGYSCPGIELDQLHCTSCDASQPRDIASQCELCGNVQARRMSRDDASPVIHYGIIASGNKLVKDAILRDQLRQRFGAKCVEMEAAGLMNEFSCIVIRGICDYADSYKNDVWQEYAALTAAAFAKELLLYIVPEQVNCEKPLQGLTGFFEKQITISKGLLDETRQQHKVREIQYENDKYRRCHQAFKTSRYEELKNNNPERVPGTCQWVLNNSTYKRWQDSQNHDLLWISADPGCGKSVLARSLIDNELHSNEDRKVCYFFFKDNEDQNSLCTALSAVLHQLFDLEPRLLHHAMGAWGKNHDKVSTEVDEMWRILLAAAKDSQASSVVCVLDALDECRDNDRFRLINKLSRFYQENSNTSPFTPSNDQQGRLKFLVTSRPYGDIRHGFQMPSNLPSIRLRGEEESEQIHQEINKVIAIRVHTLADDLGLNSRTKDRIESELLQMENRTYLWLYLAVESLRVNLSNSLRPAEESIERLPSTVEDAYEKILSRVQEGNQDRVKLILQIVIGAERPLTIGEMAIALGVATSQHKDAKTLTEIIIDETYLERWIRQWCGLFIVFHQKRLHLIHQTAKEFLIHQQISTTLPMIWRHSLSLAQCESTMAHICVNFLLFQDVSEVGEELAFTLESGGWAAKSKALNTEDKVELFALYSAGNWASHLEKMGSSMDNKLMKKVLSLYDTTTELFDWWFPIFAEVGDHRCDHFDNPIYIAARNGHREAVQFLLDNEQSETDQRDPLGKTALTWASQFGHESVVKLLIDRGADVNAARESYSGALYEASRAGHQSIVELLLSNGARRLNSALSAASFKGHLTIVELLLDRGANNLDFALYQASAGGCEAVLQLLLSKGAKKHDRALERASAGGHQTIVELLLREGAGGLDDALCAASAGGHQTIVELLLREGAGGLDDALCAVSERGYQAIVELLLSKGAKKLNLALKAASGGGFQNIVELLLSEGATNLDGALLKASAKGREAVVELLLSRGAKKLDRALERASKEGHEHIVELLQDEIARREEEQTEKRARRNPIVDLQDRICKISLDDDNQVVSENSVKPRTHHYNLRSRGPV